MAQWHTPRRLLIDMSEQKVDNEYVQVKRAVLEDMLKQIRALKAELLNRAT